VIANLPFHRTADLLHLLLDDPTTPLTRADLVVEWGVAFKRAVPWPSRKAQVSRMLNRSFVGPPQTVRAVLTDFANETQADELIVAAAVHDHPARLRSYELLATGVTEAPVK
jgi:alkanesulfonate monooxygenase SsuD/methylene tetrahydromethanopterin reductase-like flavin-dependent oxidoreductase (luciferase family)